MVRLPRGFGEGREHVSTSAVHVYGSPTKSPLLQSNHMRKTRVLDSRDPVYILVGALRRSLSRWVSVARRRPPMAILLTNRQGQTDSCGQRRQVRKNGALYCIIKPTKIQLSRNLTRTRADEIQCWRREKISFFSRLRISSPGYLVQIVSNFRTASSSLSFSNFQAEEENNKSTRRRRMAEKERNEDSKSSMVEETKDPGASRLGNFINYYKFHSAEERVLQLPRGVWIRPTSHQDRKYIGLDVGCNAGDLTVLLQKFLRHEVRDEKTEVHLLGIDIDPILIERAREQNDPSSDHLIFECLDFMDNKSRCALLTNYLAEYSRERFDVVFCFSITMWIHLNHGDEGLVDYLEAVCSLTEIIVVEPQSWKCYRNASRRLRRAGIEDFQLIDRLKLNGDLASHVDRIITNNCSFRRITCTEVNEWGRNLLIYERHRE